MRFLFYSVFLCAFLVTEAREGVGLRQDESSLMVLLDRLDRLEQENIDLRIRLERMEKNANVEVLVSDPLAELERELSAAASGEFVEAAGSFTPSGMGFDGATNPDMGFVGTIEYGSFSSRPGRLEFEEAEIQVSGYVDPFSKYDLVIGLHDEEISLEEAYLSRFDLPYGLSGRIGKFKAGLGFYNQHHHDELPWAGPNWLHEEYLGEEGLATEGFGLGQVFSSRGKWTPSLYYELSYGDDFVHTAIDPASTDEYGLNPHIRNSAQSDTRHIVRFRNTFDLTGYSILNVGLNYLRADHGLLDLTVLDFQYRNSPSSYRSFMLSGEFFQRRDDSYKDFIAPVVHPAESYQKHEGFMLASEYQLDTEWKLGASMAEFDSMDNITENSSSQAVWLAYYKSEFSRTLLQYEKRSRPGQDDDHRTTVQFIFNTGYHRHRMK